MNKNLNFQYMLDSKEFCYWIQYGQAKKKGKGRREKGEGRGKGRETIPKISQKNVQDIFLGDQFLILWTTH